MTAKTDTQLARAIELHRLQDLEGAAALYEKIIRRDPQHFFAHHALGAIYAEAGRAAEALPLLTRAARLAPDNAEAQANLGAALIAQNRLDEAEVPIHRAVVLSPDATEPLNHLGKLLSRRGRYDEALDAYARVLERNQADPVAHFNVGNTLFLADRSQQAIPSLRRAVQLEPGSAIYRTGLGLALSEIGEIALGLAQIRRAIALDPADVTARRAEYGLLLAEGDWRQGWQKYESRRLGVERFFFHDRLAVPQWAGEDLSGKRILLHAEQGLGDTLLFVRYLAQVRARRPAQIILAVQPALKGFLAAGSEADLVLGFGEPLPDIDVHCPLMSLPLAFGTRVETAPAAPGYLRRHLTPRPDAAALLAELPRPRIGLVWSGNLQGGRSMPLETLAPLLAVEGVNFVTLQLEISTADAAYLAKMPRIKSFGRSFADTAAVIDGLDLVITVDTALAHLAAGLGVPCWILLAQRADWRWLKHRTDTPWYPSARLFRQKDGAGWPPVIAALLSALKEFLAQR
jgi:tetratricopeptide (TPR) repeat protein